MRTSQSDAHVERQSEDSTLNGVITREDARVLAEAYTKLASVYARVARVKVGPKTGVTHRVRDPNRPKRPPTAYILFSLDKRAGIAARNEGMRSQDVAVEIGKEWRTLSEEARREYQIEADVRRDKFFADLDVYNKSKKAPAKGSVESDDEYQPPTNGVVPEPEVHAPASNGTHTDDVSKKTKKKKSSDPNSTKKKARKSKSGHEGEETLKKKKKSKQPAEAT
ncbi:High mobility group box 1 [Coemansia sp. RSA 1807]|nr:High mobility group box 1 [Coemansia sp. RSA 532]KAJ2290032.1 High mobility group box 1 [Coemansia sp. RSA 353]KAJ2577224.1 High mobility group box 1 [Coemansia sp. RSA 1807]